MEFTLKRIDPLKKQAERGETPHAGLSPMDPPDAFAPPNMAPVPPGEMHPHLREFVEDHVAIVEQLDAFENVLAAIRKDGYTKEADGRLKEFFRFFEEKIIPHSRREETTVFRVLRERLIAAGEHGVGDDPATAIDVMEDEHRKATQLAAVIVNFIGLALRFPEEGTRLVILDAALEQSRHLIELLRLHSFREDNIIFAQAHRLIADEAFDRMQAGQRGAHVL